MELDRTLAFTALHDASPDFRALALDPMGEAITEFLEDHKRYVQAFSGGVVKVGKTDMMTYARVWVKSYFPYES